MKLIPHRHSVLVVWAVLLVGLGLAEPASGHCDAVDGPVAKDVERAIDEQDVTIALKWIVAEDEAEARRVFERAMRVRTTGDESAAMADRYLLETIVRLHRKSEGEPYTGLKPAEQPLPTPIKAVDAAIAGGSVDTLIFELQQGVERAVRDRFEQARATAASAERSVESGRAAVHAYVELVHFTKRLHEMISADSHSDSFDEHATHH